MPRCDDSSLFKGLMARQIIANGVSPGCQCFHRTFCLPYLTRMQLDPMVILAARVGSQIQSFILLQNNLLVRPTKQDPKAVTSTETSNREFYKNEPTQKLFKEALGLIRSSNVTIRYDAFTCLRPTTAEISGAGRSSNRRYPDHPRSRKAVLDLPIPTVRLRAETLVAQGTRRGEKSNRLVAPKRPREGFADLTFFGPDATENLNPEIASDGNRPRPG
jgi:hypothetical protein